LTSDA